MFCGLTGHPSIVRELHGQGEGEFFVRWNEASGIHLLLVSFGGTYTLQTCTTVSLRELRAGKAKHRGSWRTSSMDDEREIPYLPF